MKAVRFNSLGEPADVLTIENMPDPVPGPGEVRVRMLASPINPADLMFIRGVFGKQPDLPATPGFEGVGVVEDGQGLLARFLRGKRVSVLNRERGNWSEQTIVAAKQAIPVSDSIPIEQAACFFVNPASAWTMTQDVLKVPRGEWLLQTAAASSLGQMVVRLGKERGFRTLCVVRRDEQAERLKDLGADEVVVFTDGDDPATLQSAVHDTTSGGVRYAIDPVGGATGSAVVECLGHGGRMLVYGTLAKQPLEFSSRTLMRNAATVEGFWLSNHMSSLRLPGKLKLVRNISKLAQSGVLRSEVEQTFSLDEVHAAVTAAAQPGRTGKIVLRMND